MLLGFLAATTYAAPCTSATGADQVAFSTIPDQVAAPRVGGKVRSASELNAQMQQAIEREMSFVVNIPKYMEEIGQQMLRGGGGNRCVMEWLTDPRIDLIPARRLSQVIHCTTPTCTIGYHDTVSVSTTHSMEVGFSAEVNSAPFGMGVTFTASSNLGFSTTNEQSTTFSYEFDLERGDNGYIGIVNAQISAKLRVRMCDCYQGEDCLEKCTQHPNSDETGFHEAVIMENNKPRSIVAFVYE